MKNQYKTLFNFLGSWFPDSDFEEKTEIMIIKDFKKTTNEAELNTIISEAEEVKRQIKNYWVTISKETNLYFENEQKAEQWLAKILTLLKQQ